MDGARGAAEVNYLLCATPRTGSYLLCDLLRRSGAGNPTEYFSAGYQAYWMARWGVADYPAYLARVRATSLGASGIRGVKAHPRQFQFFLRQANGGQWPSAEAHRGLLESLLPDCRYVWLRRHDRLRQAVSWARSMQTNVWWDADEAPAPFDEPKPDALRFDGRLIDEALVRMGREDRMWADFFEQAAITPLVVWYEDLAHDQVDATNRVRAHLGVLDRTRSSAPASTLRKQSDAVTERWCRRYLALDATRIDHSWAATRNLDPGADLLIVRGSRSRPDGWDEARHSLLQEGDGPADFKPDYRLADGGPHAGASAELTFAVRPATGHVRIAPDADALSVAGQLGVDRVGDPAGRRDVTGAVRVLALGDRLDVTGFLGLPPRPEHERRRVDGLRIAVPAAGVEYDWASSLASGIDALTGHHLWREGDPSPDVVITDSESAAADRWPGVAAVLVRPLGDQPTIELEVHGRRWSAPVPLAWWLPGLRSSPLPSAPLVVSGPTGGPELADLDGVLVNADRADAHVVIDPAPRPGRRALLAAASGRVVVARWAGVDGWWSGAPFRYYDPAGIREVIVALRNDRSWVEELGSAHADWVRRQWDFTDQWDAAWAPALAAATADRPDRSVR